MKALVVGFTFIATLDLFALLMAFALSGNGLEWTKTVAIIAGCFAGLLMALFAAGYVAHTYSEETRHEGEAHRG